MKTVAKRQYKTGRFATPEYRAWCHIKSRCSNPNVKDYANYGGRGIKVCERWASSFENFLEDMGERPKGLTLDRIDVNGDYSPENCRWATWSTQASNKRNNTAITYNGETHNLTEWARILNVKRSTLSMRYYVYGWSTERILGGK